VVSPPKYGTIVLAFFALIVLFGCATPGESSSGRSTLQERYLITRADLEGMEDLNAFEAIRRLRPIWLRYRGQSVLVAPEREGMRVYVNRSYFGDAQSLSTLMVRDIREIRFLDARQATLQYGTDHSVGAIVITTGGT
jgi:hypothetical protein